MPVYDFTCAACGHRFDKLFRSMPDKPKAACPKCGSGKTERALSLVNAGKSEPSGSAAAEMPMCGRCGVPGPCGMR